MLQKTFAPFPILKSDRLTLRKLTLTDDQEIFVLRSDLAINKYLGRKLSSTIDDARAFINTVNENVDKNESVYWAITLNDSNSLVGTICLYGFSDEGDSCEIGYELLTNFQGQGIMREAVSKVIDYAFHTIGVKKIEAFFHCDNQNSIKLLEKFSFVDSKDLDKTGLDLLCYYLLSARDSHKRIEPKKNLNRWHGAL